jgi:beta-lactamase regulating signal transducer with metallopeptidase domain
MKNSRLPSVLSLIVLAALLLAIVPVPVLAQNASQGDTSVKVEAQSGGSDTSGGGGSTSRTTTTSWTADPIWIGLGIVVAILVILLIVVASRRGNQTTVIKD